MAHTFVWGEKLILFYETNKIEQQLADKMLTPDNVNLYEVMIMHYVNFHVNDGDRHEFIRGRMSERAGGKASERAVGRASERAGGVFSSFIGVAICIRQIGATDFTQKIQKIDMELKYQRKLKTKSN